MKTIFSVSVLSLSIAAQAMAATSVVEQQKVLNVYNWSDYIAPDTVANFEKETGIKVQYDVFDSNEVLEAKLLSGNTGYDIVAPSVDFVPKQIKAGVYQKLDYSLLPNAKNLDPSLIKLVDIYDPQAQYSVPYLWGTTGIGYNKVLVEKALGSDTPVESWRLVFDKNYISKLSGCGVAFLNSPTEIIPAAMVYYGFNPNGHNLKEYKQVEQKLMEIRPYVTYFNSSRFISDLANGDICVAVGFSGDVLQARDRAVEAENGIEIAYSIPQEGAGIWFDMLAIPKDAKNVAEAHAFINYLMRPDVIAGVTNYVAYANPNQAATPLVEKEISSDSSIYPNDEVKQRLFAFEALPSKVNRVVSRIFTRFTSGK